MSKLSQADRVANNLALQIADLVKENAILRANLEIASEQIAELQKEKENETSD